MTNPRSLLLLLALPACTTHTRNLALSEMDGGRDAAADGALDAHDDASDAEPWDGSLLPVRDADVVYCGIAPCACSNGRDDDEDGLADGDDPECTGAFDNYEDNFATGVPDEERDPKCQDCYFDRVPGRDVCNRPTSCAINGTPQNGTGQCPSCGVPPACADHCSRLAPNGCDCFGCCEVFRDGLRFEILLRRSCTVDALGDTTRCTPCIRARDCQNPCEPCELCPGKTLSDLPIECVGYTCVDTTLCRTSADCAASEYCQNGCCLITAI